MDIIIYSCPCHLQFVSSAYLLASVIGLGMALAENTTLSGFDPELGLSISDPCKELHLVHLVPVIMGKYFFFPSWKCVSMLFHSIPAPVYFKILGEFNVVSFFWH